MLYSYHNTPGKTIISYIRKLKKEIKKLNPRPQKEQMSEEGFEFLPDRPVLRPLEQQAHNYIHTQL